MDSKFLGYSLRCEFEAKNKSLNLTSTLNRAKSHFIVGNALMEGLAKAGHEVQSLHRSLNFIKTNKIFVLQVTVLSAFAPKKIVANYTHVHVDGLYEHLKGMRGSFTKTSPLAKKKYRKVTMMKH